MNRRLAVYAIAEKLLTRGGAWRLGRFLYNGAQRALANDPRINGEYVLQERVLERTPADADLVFLDIGANRGDWSAELAGKLVSARPGRGTIFAFEPAPRLRDAFDRRLAPFAGDVRLESRGEAVTDVVGEAAFDITGDDTGTSALATGGSAGTLTVPTITVDAFLADRAIGHVRLAKVDTEGNDLNVLRGARASLAAARIDVVQFEFNWRWIAFSNRLRDAFDLAADVGYAVGQLTADAIEVHDAWHHELERITETNFVLLSPRSREGLGVRQMVFDRSNVAVERR